MNSDPLRVVFFVQAEGRGHMTQALALKEILEDAGHQVVAAFMGENPERPIPEFFPRRFASPIHTYLAPVFVVDSENKGVRPWDSFFQALRRFPRYWSQGPELHRDLRSYRPDVIVNFYDLVGGLYTAVYRPPAPVIALGHQFLFFHPQFRVPEGESFQVAMIKLNTDLTSLNARLRMGLSFSPMQDLPEKRIRVVPPLLRREVLDAEPSRGDHILAYVLNPGYARELEEWHERQSGVELHCFWDRVEAPPAYSPREGLTFHRLDDTRFLELLQSCRGFTSTAGFESVCEAAFLGKPVLVVPTAKHVEQLCNALDADRAGLATWQHDFDLSALLTLMEAQESKGRREFRDWILRAPEIYIRLLEGVVRGENVMKIPLPGPTVSSRPPR